MTAVFVKNDKFDDEFRSAVQAGVNGFVLVVAGALRESLSQRGTGRRYRVARGKKSGRNLRARGFHQASAAGFPPAPNTGALRRSWGISASQLKGEIEKEGGTGESTSGMAKVEEFDSLSKTRVGYRISSPLHYAKIDSGYGKVAARPYIERSLAAAEPEFENIMRDILGQKYPATRYV